ncbi:MAG TPA: hypothetical protein VMQ61_15335 [Thermoanaerobaculia bacterium]|nr:hypothetical protein [Thermoanaerobaculia bacterium]
MNPGPATRPDQRPIVTEHGLSVAWSVKPERNKTRTILYERLTGEAARERARQPEPRGAGLPAEIVDQIEYIEVWSTPNEPVGYDFRGYSFGGVLIASRSTRA